MFYQLLLGVHALHDASPHSLVHRDLKLSNISVVSYDERSIAVVILDYGQTVQVHSQRPIGEIAATPEDEALEMLHQVHHVDVENYRRRHALMFIYFCHSALLLLSVEDPAFLTLSDSHT